MLKVKKIDENFRKDLVNRLNAWKELPRKPEYNLKYPWSGIECTLGKGNNTHEISISTDRVDSGEGDKELVCMGSYANGELFTIPRYEYLFHLKDRREYVIGREHSEGPEGTGPVYCMSNDGGKMTKMTTNVKSIRNDKDWTLSRIQLYMRSDPGKEPDTHDIGIYNIGLGNLDVRIHGYDKPKTSHVINLEL